ncbi:MAG TPA: MlaD family protein [Geobacteraceae bacterium]
MAFSVEKKVGFFFIACLVILGVLLEIGEKWNPFEKKVLYKTYLSSVTGLKVGDPVRLSGVDVGRIKAVNIQDNRIEIAFEVKPGTHIKTDSVASLRLTNLLGGQFLGISFGSTEAPLLEPGGTVRSKDTANIDVIVDNVSDLTKDAKSLINSLNKNQNDVLQKMSALLDDNRADLRESVANFRSISEKFDRGDGSLALLLNDKTLYTSANDATQNLKNITAKIDKGEGTVGKLINDPTLYNDAQATLASLKGGVADLNTGMKDFKEITAKVNRGEGTVGKLVNDDSLYTELKDASKNIKEVAQKINSGEGTLGKLVNEDKLYRETTAAMKKVEKAAEGLGDSGPISVLGSIIGTLF